MRQRLPAAGVGGGEGDSESQQHDTMSQNWSQEGLNYQLPRQNAGHTRTLSSSPPKHQQQHHHHPHRQFSRSFSSDKDSKPSSPMVPSGGRRGAPGLPIKRPSITSTTGSMMLPPRSPISIQTSGGFLPVMSTNSINQSFGQSRQRIMSLADSTSGGSVPRFVPPPESLMKGLESTTSSSLLHGLNMITIMLSSLGAFICALVQDACDEASFSPVVVNGAPLTVRCSILIAAAFPLVNILSCITFFVMYFLHLVGQCDYLSWSARRKVTLELMGTLAVLLLVVTVTILVYLTTPAWGQETTRYGIVFSTASVLFILVRILLLAREIPMLLSKPQADARSAAHQQHHNHHQHQQISCHSLTDGVIRSLTPPALSAMTMGQLVQQAPPSPPLELLMQHQPQLPQRRRSTTRRKKRALVNMRSFSIKRSSVADTIDLESAIPCHPIPMSVKFTRMSMLQSDDFLPGGGAGGNGSGAGAEICPIAEQNNNCVTTDSARSSMTTQDHVFRSSSEVEDERTLLSAYPKVTHI